MPSDFQTVAALDEILEDHIDQFAAWLNGDTNYRKIAAPTANDASNYLLTLKNVGSGGKALLVEGSGGADLVTVNDDGTLITHNDATDYALTVRNTGASGFGFLVKNAAGTSIFSVSDAGVGLLNNTGLFPGQLTGGMGGTPAAGGLYRDNLVSAWATGTMSGTVWTQTDGFNVTVTRASAGVFTLAFTTTLSAATYCMLAMSGSNNLNAVESTGVPRATTGCQMAFFDTTTTLVDPTVGISFLVVGPG